MGQEHSEAWLRRTVSTLWRMLRDVVLTVICLAVVVLLVALALAVLVVLPFFLAYLVLARLLYWLVTRVPMWINPNSLGRIHTWHWTLNVVIFAGIGEAMRRLGAPIIESVVGSYVGFLVAQAWYAIGWLVERWLPNSANNCGETDTAVAGCRKVAVGWLTTGPRLDFAVGTVLVVLMAATLYALMSRLDEAGRLKMVESNAG